MQRSSKVKKQILLIGLLAFSVTLFAQQMTHKSTVVNIEVPVRVYKGNVFIDNLTLADFGIFENGVSQKVEAVYLIKKRTIERSEENKRFVPETVRNFYLFFEISEYTPRMGEAVDYFIQKVLYPGDFLTVVTPMKTYRLKREFFEQMPRENVANRLKNILRKDALQGSAEYRSAVNDITGLAKTLSGSTSQDALGLTEFQGLALDESLSLYRVLLRKLEDMRTVDQQKLLDFAEYLGDKEGQKYVYLFYQREFIPQLEQRVIDQMISANLDRQDIVFALSELFGTYRREISVNIDKIKQAYANSSISVHFLFFSKPPRDIPGIDMKEHSEDIFSAFREIAQATGGFTESSANPIFLFQSAVKASENYYLLYYSPSNYQNDGKFKEIKVKIKDKNYKVSHRAGYFAN